MKHVLLFGLLGLIFAACTSGNNETSANVAVVHTAASATLDAQAELSSNTQEDERAWLPAPSKPAATTDIFGPALHPPYTPTPFVVANLDAFPGNVASGESAPDFTARLASGTYVLSRDQQGYLLLFPTVVGCGECMFGIREIATVVEANPQIDLEVLVMDLYARDDPRIWDFIAERVTPENFLWGVVWSEQFTLDYEILSLGTILLIDPQGNLIFRSENPLAAFHYEKLFELISPDY
ncbi:MAG: hypothetical protein DWQ07_18040 [Chloroflexi bacterium]|nr:MAG: hypothetical protein DWQ07_18040 [Chloroflexota bacterium]